MASFSHPPGPSQEEKRGCAAGRGVEGPEEAML